MEDLEFTPIEPEDFDAVCRLWRDSVALMGLDGTVLPELAFFTEKLTEVRRHCEVTVARGRGRVLGFIAVDLEAGVLDQLFLAPDVLRQGIGSRLFALACARLPEGFTLYTPSSNARARAFYEAQGMAFSHEGRHPVWGHPVTHYAWTPK